MNKTKSTTILRTLLSVLLLCFFVNMGTLKAEAATASQREACKQELQKMLYSADPTVHDISRYRLTTSEFRNITASLETGEDRLIWESYYSNMYIDYTTSLFYVKNVKIVNIDDDVLRRYEVLKKNVEEVMAGLRDDMTDLDKLIHFHDSIVDIATYRFVAYQSYGACGILGDEEGVCAGYTKALKMFLDMVNIQSIYVVSEPLDHCWNKVLIDGEWYHVDSTWDDTRSATKGVPGHQHLLRNDEEFSGWKSHVEWDDATENISASTRFSDWFVHDITGNMFYEDTYWYYVDNATNNLMKAKATGEDMQVLVNGAGKGAFTILSVKDGVATYSCGGKQYRSDSDDTILPTLEDIYQVEEYPDMSDFSNWQSGVYNHLTGLYEANKHRICLNSYYPAVSSTEYTVSISNTDCNVLIREMSKDFKRIASHDLTNGECFTTKADCAYLAISIYSPSRDTKITFADFENIFSKDDFTVSVTNVAAPSAPDPAPTPAPATPVIPDNETTVVVNSWNDISSWQTGLYNWTDGSYMKYKSRICLKEHVVCTPNTVMTADISDTDFSLLIRELDTNGKFIGTYTLADGEDFTTAPNCSYLAVSLYSPSKDNVLNYNSYVELFSNGVNIALISEADTDPLQQVQAPQVSNTIYWNDFSLWQSGMYHWTTGKYMKYSSRLCLLVHVPNNGIATFKAKLSDSGYHLLVRQLDSNNNFISSSDLADGECFTTAPNCCNLAISIYSPTNDTKLNYNSYRELFATGFTVGIEQL